MTRNINECVDCGRNYSLNDEMASMKRCPRCTAEYAMNFKGGFGDEKKKPAPISPKRKCHSCNRMTYSFECPSCQKKRRSQGYGAD